ncbi:alpha/beta hydrolase family protein [Candidatus Synechococcus spongiarum]|nr:hypothetical protein [Candidatus Synechococcus spongiarum]
MGNLSLLIALLFATPFAAQADPAGYKTFSRFAPHHGQDLEGGIWYPAFGSGRETMISENAVFYGVTVSKDAPMANGDYPLVLLSHGLGGHFHSLTWLAAGLAERGAIVIAVNHPHSTFGDFDSEAALDHWTRVQDLSLVLDRVFDDPEIAPHVDPDRIVAAGFSYGGWTALSVGGLRGDLDGFATYCRLALRPENQAISIFCHDLAQAKVDSLALSAEAWAASYADDRITHVAAIDPGLTWGLDATHTTGLVSHVTLIGLGKGSDRLMATDFDASGFAALLPDADILRLSPAFHFSALPLCKPDGAVILKEEGDDPVCNGPDSADRASLHAAMISKLATDLDL